MCTEDISLCGPGHSPSATRTTPLTYSEPMSDKEAETSAPVHELIARRWSPRALDDMADVTADQLRALLEAARWAP